jgi:hypothetical protein
MRRREKKEIIGKGRGGRWRGKRGQRRKKRRGTERRRGKEGGEEGRGDRTKGVTRRTGMTGQAPGGIT